MPRQNLHIQKAEIKDNKRICFMNNRYPMDQFEFIEQKFQICDLLSTVLSTVSLAQRKIHIKFRRC